jgi:hypothetical protein
MTTDLPECSHRSAETTLHNGRDRFTCTHPQVCRPNPSELVVEQQCRECAYVGFEAAAAKYQPSNAEQPTIDEYEARAAICRTCEVRVDNFCPQSGGSCSLAQKLGKPDFTCPAGKFEAINR